MTQYIYDNPKTKRREFWVDDELRISISPRYVGIANSSISFAPNSFISLPWKPHQKVTLDEN